MCLTVDSIIVVFNGSEDNLSILRNDLIEDVICCAYRGLGPTAFLIQSVVLWSTVIHIL